jgi:DNA-binding beta-propeller fold protein YncE
VRVLNIILLGLSLTLLWGCREDQVVILSESVPVAPPEKLKGLVGFYLLNEGNMGSNKCTLDFMDLQTGIYHRNIYGEANPEVPKELGDVGNDIAIYGGRLYAVINCSNKVEVMDKWTARRIGQIDIPNCRYIKFDGGYAYITSYAGPVLLTPDYDQIGYVAKVDTATLREVARCEVGFQPDELEIVGNRMYVANSGGYMSPNYETTVSVIDMESFTEVKRIEVAVNLHRLKADSNGLLWVSSRGDYEYTPSQLYIIDLADEEVCGSVDVGVSSMCLAGDSLYILADDYSYLDNGWRGAAYSIVDVVEQQVVSDNFIKDGTERDIKMPYGISVNPVNGDIYVTNATSFVDPGRLICYSKQGRKKWEVRTGDIPAHFAYLWR